MVSRWQGIEDGQRRAMALGIGGKRVYFAPEFNMVQSLQEAGMKSVLYDVVPFVPFDYLSYSSYQSIGQASPQEQLVKDLDRIMEISGSNAIMVGEVITCSYAGGDIEKLDDILEAALGWGVPYIVHWNLFEISEVGCGVYGIDGQLTPVGEFYAKYLRGVTTCDLTTDRVELLPRRETHSRPRQRQ